MKSPAELSSLFRARGMKVTPQRELVFRLLHNNESHPSADSVHAIAVEQMPMISLKTVYQVLNELKTLGELQTIEVGTGALRFDPNLTDHHHLVCSGCGLVHDVPLDTSDLRLSQRQRNGFAIHDVQVTFRGLCDTCRLMTKAASRQ